MATVLDSFTIDKRGSGPSRVRGSWTGRELRAGVREAGKRAITRSIQKVFEESQKEVPVLTTQLKTSGRIEEKKGGPDSTIRLSVVYGDDELRFGNKSPSSKYVRRQHEDLTLNHPRGGKAKFLEDPLKRSKAEFFRLLREEIDREL